MGRITRSAQAERDVVDIGDYIARDNLEAAIRFVESIDSKLELIAASPRIGQACDYLAPNLRKLAIGRYLLIYRPVEGGIEFVRLLHGARNLRALFE